MDPEIPDDWTDEPCAVCGLPVWVPPNWREGLEDNVETKVVCTTDCARKLTEKHEH